MDRLMDFLSRTYRNALVWCLGNRWKVIIAAFAIFAGSLFLIGGARKEFVPPQDIGVFMMTLRTPLGSSLEFTDNVVKKAEALFKTRPEIVTFYTAIGGFQGGLVNQDIFFITLKNYNKRPVAAPFKRRPTQQEFMAYARDEVKKIPGLEAVSVLDPSLGGFSASRGYPIQFSVQGPDWEKLAEYSKKIMGEMNKTKLVTDVDTDLQLGMPEIRVHPDRNNASARGVTITNIADTISAAVGSLRVGKYTDESGHRDDIRIKLLDKYNRQPQDINKIMVRNIHGEVVSLANVVTLQEKPSLLTITRYNRERAVTIFANIAPGKSQTDILSSIQKISKNILPAGYFIVFSGSSETFKESFQSLIFALILGIVVAYMILGTQYNSFIHPVTILLALPFSVTGAFLAIRLTGISLNIYSMIGILLLMGIVKKNSILLVDFTNTRRIAGMGVHEALLEACPIRLRPILMTSVATISAALPIALAVGMGSETTRPMAIVVIGGVLVSTFLTLFVVPCAYSLFSRFESKRHREELHEALVSLGEIVETKKKKK
jgi:HAE1 family hydrophobic/amphiphilic exporter-1